MGLSPSGEPPSVCAGCLRGERSHGGREGSVPSSPLNRQPSGDVAAFTEALTACVRCVPVQYLSEVRTEGCHPRQVRAQSTGWHHGTSGGRGGPESFPLIRLPSLLPFPSLPPSSLVFSSPLPTHLATPRRGRPCRSLGSSFKLGRPPLPCPAAPRPDPSCLPACSWLVLHSCEHPSLGPTVSHRTRRSSRFLHVRSAPHGPATAYLATCTLPSVRTRPVTAPKNTFCLRALSPPTPALSGCTLCRFQSSNDHPWLKAMHRFLSFQEPALHLQPV